MLTQEKVLLVLLKDFTSNYTLTKLADKLNITRSGIWKVVKKLESNNLVNFKKIGKGKTNTMIINLNWNNILLEKTLEVLLTKESLTKEKWRYVFQELEDVVDFLILFGSVLNSPKTAEDIDILSKVSGKGNFVKINKIIKKIQITENKKIHEIGMTKNELKLEIKNKNKAYLEAFKKGTVLFGQEKFIKFIKELQNV